MVAPVVFHGTTVRRRDASPSYYETREKRTQAKPFDQVLPWKMRTGDVVWSNAGTPPDSYCSAFALSTGFDMISQVGTWDPWHHLENRLYDKFKDGTSSRASLAVGLAEVSQSVQMLTGRAMQMARFYRQLRKLDFQGAARTLRMPGPPKGVSTKKSLANNYLEFHFGWSPLIGDIGNAIDVLQEPIKTVWIRERVSEPTRLYDLSAPSKGSNPSAVYPSPTWWDDHRYWKGRRSVSCGAEVSVSNPNLWLANQLGFVNPASVAWELVPFSFVVDWFVNVGQVVDSYTDFYGLTLSKTWTTRFYTGLASYKKTGGSRYWENGKYIHYSWAVHANGPFTCVDRRTGLPSPVFALKPWRPWGWRRAAAAVALLVQLHRGW